MMAQMLDRNLASAVGQIDIYVNDRLEEYEQAKEQGQILPHPEDDLEGLLLIKQGIFTAYYTFNEEFNYDKINLFPIGNWPFIYGLARRTLFENDSFTKENVISPSGEIIGIRYISKEDPDNRIIYNLNGRPERIDTIEGYVKFTYEENNLQWQPCANY